MWELVCFNGVEVCVDVWVDEFLLNLCSKILYFVLLICDIEGVECEWFVFLFVFFDVLFDILVEVYDIFLLNIIWELFL